MRIEFFYSHDIATAISKADPFEIWEFKNRLNSHRVKDIFQTLRYEYENGSCLAMVYNNQEKHVCTFGIVFGYDFQQYSFMNANYVNSTYKNKGFLRADTLVEYGWNI